MELTKRKLLQAGILEEFWDKDFNNFYGHEEKRNELQPKVIQWNTAYPDIPINLNFNQGQRILEEVMEYAQNLKNARKHGISLFLFGPNGSGKTLLAVSVLKEALRQGFSAQMSSLGGIIEATTAGWYNSTKKEVFESKIKNVDFLLIDDIGKEYKAKGNNLVEVAFDNLIRYRSFRNKPIIFTSNTKLQELNTTYGQSVSSLLIGKCIAIRVAGDDYRKVIQAKELRKLLKNG